MTSALHLGQARLAAPPHPQQSAKPWQLLCETLPPPEQPQLRRLRRFLPQLQGPGMVGTDQECRADSLELVHRLQLLWLLDDLHLPYSACTG